MCTHCCYFAKQIGPHGKSFSLPDWKAKVPGDGSCWPLPRHWHWKPCSACKAAVWSWRSLLGHLMPWGLCFMLLLWCSKVAHSWPNLEVIPSLQIPTKAEILNWGPLSYALKDPHDYIASIIYVFIIKMHHENGFQSPRITLVDIHLNSGESVGPAVLLASFCK